MLSLLFYPFSCVGNKIFLFLLEQVEVPERRLLSEANNSVFRALSTVIQYLWSLFIYSWRTS